MTDLELAPCPFCGAEPEIVVTATSKVITPYKICCSDHCEDDTPISSYYLLSAIHAWNTSASAINQLHDPKIPKIQIKKVQSRCVKKKTVQSVNNRSRSKQLMVIRGGNCPQSQRRCSN